jgi:simple sugar transport system substrate-binding protein
MRGSVQLATFDISPTVLEAVRDGDMLFAIDQQMFLQTYLSVVDLVTYIQYRRSPVTSVPSGPNFVTAQDAQELIELSAGGFV